MCDYRLYRLDADGRIRGVVELQAQGDDEAVALVVTQPVEADLELWSRDRIVKAFAKDRPAGHAF